jgi:hypothetical protein
MNYAKELNEFRERMENYEGMDFEEAPEFEEWVNMFNKRLGEVSAECMKELPEQCKDKGFAEVYFVGLARFTCRLLNKMEREGMFSEGKDGFGFYTKVVMPICYDMVKSELDEEEHLNDVADEVGIDHDQVKAAKLIFDALADDKMTEEEIFEKYIQSDDRESYIHELREMRAEIRAKQKGN